MRNPDGPVQSTASEIAQQRLKASSAWKQTRSVGFYNLGFLISIVFVMKERESASVVLVVSLLATDLRSCARGVFAKRGLINGMSLQIRGDLT